MLIRDAQRQVRTVFLGGFAGKLVSGIIWLVSAALALVLALVLNARSPLFGPTE